PNATSGFIWSPKSDPARGYSPPSAVYPDWPKAGNVASNARPRQGTTMRATENMEVTSKPNFEIRFVQIIVWPPRKMLPVSAFGSGPDPFLNLKFLVLMTCLLQTTPPDARPAARPTAT